MEHYLTKIIIDKVRHLNNIEINLAPDYRQHLILTGKNGAGKTSVLNALGAYIAILNGKLLKGYNQYINYMLFEENKSSLSSVFSEFYAKYYQGIRVEWNNSINLDDLYTEGNLITAYFRADRKFALENVKGVENVKLETSYRADDDPSEVLLKYMVHLKTQQSYAQNEKDEEIREIIALWFERFEAALKELIDDDSIQLKYDYRNYNFLILQDGKEPYDFGTLSDGYSSVIRIASDLMLRMDQNWLLKGSLCEYDREGIVLIDELETHLHIELQRKILPFLTKFFPKIQFIITTHSPYIVTSIDNALVFDLERQVEISDPSMYSPEDVAEGYFNAENYSESIKKMMWRLKILSEKTNITDDERAERAELRQRLNNSKGNLAVEILNELDSLEGMTNGKI